MHEREESGVTNEILLQYYSQPNEILGHGLNDSILALITYFGVYFNV